MRLVPRGHDPGVLDHEDHRAFRRPRAVHHSFWHDETLSRRQFDRAALEVDQQAAVDNVKELVIIGVLVLVILALHDS